MAQNLAARTKQKSEQRRTDNPAPQPTETTKPLTVYNVIAAMTDEIALALPKHLDADRMARLTLTVVKKNPKLAACTPQSFAGALLTASALGLEPGVMEECYLVPYKVWDRDTERRYAECQLIIGYQGYIKLYFQSPLAGSLDAHKVHENDEFDYEYGTQPFLRHKPARGERGEVIFYYGVAKLITGEPRFVVLTPEEVRELRNGKEGPSGDIPDPQRWMERKTAIRQLIKLLPKSPLLAAAAAADERSGHELFRERVVERAIDNEAEVIEAAPEPPIEYEGPPEQLEEQ